MPHPLINATIYGSEDTDMQASRRLIVTLSVAAVSWPVVTVGDDRRIPAPPVTVLFVGNSYTFARVAPALQYNAANVNDLTAAFNALNPTGTNSFPVGSGIPPTPCAASGTACFEPHNWGGVPGIFKRLTDQESLNYDVSHSTRNAATLRGQFLNTANATGTLRENVATRRWNVVVLQEQSDAPLPAGKGKNANLAQFNAYADQFERFIHERRRDRRRRLSLRARSCYGSLAACAGRRFAPTGDLQHAVRNIPQSTRTRAPPRKVYLDRDPGRDPTWSTPTRCTTPDADHDRMAAPIVDPTCAAGTNGSAVTAQNTLYYTSQPTTAANLADMTTDLHNSFYGKASSNSGFSGVAPVGDAFQRAVNQGIAKGDGFYKADGTYDEPAAPPINLWWLDRTHASKYGSVPQRTGSLPDDRRPQSVEPRARRNRRRPTWASRPDVAVQLQRDRAGHRRAGHPWHRPQSAAADQPACRR